jgi:hypothetical protein
MVVALVAFIVALGGTAAASFGPFSGNKIIKKHSLSGNRLKNNTLTGSQINESKLGKVPSASHADTAGSANFANTAGSAGSVNQIHKSGLITASAGQTPAVMTLGPFVFTLTCTNPSGTIIHSQVDVATTVDHTSFESVESPIEGDFLVSTGAIGITDVTSSPAPGTADFDGDGGSFSAVDTNGGTYIGHAFAGARVQGHDCVGGVTAISYPQLV